MFEPLVIGGKVEAYKKNTSLKEDVRPREQFLSQIMDIKDESIVCTMPVDKGKLIVLEVGMELEVCFYSGKNVYNADCVISSRGKEGNIFTMELKLITPLKKFQRREYYRLECTLEADVTIIDEDESEHFKKTGSLPDVLSMPSEKGIITDISGGGLRLIMNKQYEKDTVVAVKFTIAIGGRKRDMYLPAIIILSFRKTNDESVFDNRLQFINIKSEDTEDIVKYVFEQQRFMRQKERGM